MSKKTTTESAYLAAHERFEIQCLFGGRRVALDFDGRNLIGYDDHGMMHSVGVRRVLEAALAYAYWRESSDYWNDEHSKAIAALAAAEARALAAEKERDALVTALDEALVTSGELGTFSLGDDPKATIHKLCAWSESVGEYFEKEKRMAAERERAITQWHNAVDAIRAALTREPVSNAYTLPPVADLGVIEFNDGTDADAGEVGAK